MKKLLACLSSVTVGSILSSSVVSCGIDLKHIMDRTIDTDTYHYYYSYPLQSWSTTVTMQAEDNRYLADTQSTLVRTDKYNRSVGDLAVNASDIPGLKSSGDMIVDGNVGAHNEDCNVWTYYLNPEARWSDAHGNDMGQITAKNYVYTMFNTLCSLTNSETIGVIEMFLDHYSEFLDILEGPVNEETGSREGGQLQSGTINPTDWDNPNSAMYYLKTNCVSIGTYTDDNQKTYETVTYHLSQKATYFDTVLTYTAFGPLPEKAIELQKADNGQWIPTGESYYNYGTSYKIPWISGSYIVDEYDPSRVIHLKKNKNYLHKDLVYINDLVYDYVGDSSVSKIRMLFESGDIDEVTLSPTDTKGWSKYVGDDVEHPIFDGAYSRVQPEVVTFNLTANYANTKAFDSVKDGKTTLADKNAIAEVAAINSPYIRQYIYYRLNRSDFIKYYSQGMDKGDTASCLRNVYTARDFAINNENNKDYTTYFDEHFVDQNEKYKSELSSDPNNSSLADGQDPIYNKKWTIDGDPTKFDALKSIDSNLTVPTDEKDLASKVQTEIDNIKKECGVSEIKLDFLYNGAQMTDTGQYINKMVDDFNNYTTSDNISGLSIYLDKSLDNNEYKTRQVKADYDFLISGWSPDYADPSTFLNTETFTGDLTNYNGFTRLFDPSTDNYIEDGIKLSSTGKQIYDKLGQEGKKSIQESYAIIKNYTEKVNEASNITNSIEERYKKFAEAEYDLIYRYNFLLPLYVRSGTYQVNLGFLKPRTVTTAGYGSSYLRHIEVELTDHILSSKERAIIEEKYQEDLKGFQK